MLLASFDIEGRLFAPAVLHGWFALALAASLSIPVREALFRWRNVLHTAEAGPRGHLFGDASLGTFG
ncbi:hypothetical protein D3C80_1797550 [compost metagenome]